MSSSPPVLLITGANTGLGFETVKALCQSPKAYTILLSGRNLDKATAAVQDVRKEFPQSPSTVEAVQIDIEDDESISRAFEHVASQHGRLDVLINNAGPQGGTSLPRMTRLTSFTGGAFDRHLPDSKMTLRERWNKSWDVNTTGTHVLTHTFVPLLLESADPRVMFITSGTSTLAESEDTSIRMNQSPTKGWPKQEVFPTSSYRSSKTGLNMLMREWNRILKEDGVKVWGISPGFLATGLAGDPEIMKRMGAQDPSLGANFIRDVAEGVRDQDTGKIILRNGVQPW